MRVIDLIEDIAIGKVPKKIKYDNEIWNYKEGINQYISDDDNYCLGGFDFDDLNNEVEIIEEKTQEHKIPEKLKLNTPYPECEDTRFQDIEDKINEIIDYLEKRK